jgi:hypothetical protein
MTTVMRSVMVVVVRAMIAVATMTSDVGMGTCIKMQLEGQTQG